VVQQTDDGEVALPWISFIFREATGPPQVAPKVQFRHKSGTIFQNVVNVSGTTADLEGAAFLATPPAGVTLTWRLGERGAPEGTTGNFINLPTLSEAGTQTLVLKDSNGHERRVHIEIRDKGPLLIGNENGPTFLGSPAVPGELIGNFDLMKFHQGDGLVSSDNRATLDQTGLHVPKGVLARVKLKPTVPPPEAIRHIQVRFPFDFWGEPHPEFKPPLLWTWGRASPCAGGAPLGSNVSPPQVIEWATSFTDDTQFFIVGRADDIALNGAQDSVQRLFCRSPAV
jgi:hypothetical protein